LKWIHLSKACDKKRVWIWDCNNDVLLYYFKLNKNGRCIEYYTIQTG
jgi:hypothetical protein